MQCKELLVLRYCLSHELRIPGLRISFDLGHLVIELVRIHGTLEVLLCLASCFPFASIWAAGVPLQQLVGVREMPRGGSHIDGHLFRGLAHLAASTDVVCPVLGEVDFELCDAYVQSGSHHGTDNQGSNETLCRQGYPSRLFLP